MCSSSCYAAYESWATAPIEDAAYSRNTASLAAGLSLVDDESSNCVSLLRVKLVATSAVVDYTFTHIGDDWESWARSYKSEESCESPVSPYATLLPSPWRLVWAVPRLVVPRYIQVVIITIDKVMVVKES